MLLVYVCIRLTCPRDYSMVLNRSYSITEKAVAPELGT